MNIIHYFQIVSYKMPLKYFKLATPKFSIHLVVIWEEQTLKRFLLSCKSVGIFSCRSNKLMTNFHIHHNFPLLSCSWKLVPITQATLEEKSKDFIIFCFRTGNHGGTIETQNVMNVSIYDQPLSPFHLSITDSMGEETFGKLSFEDLPFIKSSEP